MDTILKDTKTGIDHVSYTIYSVRCCGLAAQHDQYQAQFRVWLIIVQCQVSRSHRIFPRLPEMQKHAINPWFLDIVLRTALLRSGLLEEHEHGAGLADILLLLVSSVYYLESISKRNSPLPCAPAS